METNRGGATQSNYLRAQKNSLMKSKWLLAIGGVLTLGLAPFSPEPHFFGKIKWIVGGANGMKAMDYFDFLIHSAPWFYLLYLIIIFLKATLIPSAKNISHSKK